MSYWTQSLLLMSLIKKFEVTTYFVHFEINSVTIKLCNNSNLCVSNRLLFLDFPFAKLFYLVAFLFTVEEYDLCTYFI